MCSPALLSCGTQYVWVCHNLAVSFFFSAYPQRYRPSSQLPLSHSAFLDSACELSLTRRGSGTKTHIDTLPYTHALKQNTHPFHIGTALEVKKKKAISVRSYYSSYFFLILVFPQILFVCLRPEDGHAMRLINNYRVHKIGGEEKKTISLSFDVRHERNQNYKETECCKEERKLAHITFPTLCFCFFLFPSFFLLLYHLSISFLFLFISLFWFCESIHLSLWLITWHKWKASKCTVFSIHYYNSKVISILFEKVQFRKRI